MSGFVKILFITCSLYAHIVVVHAGQESQAGAQTLESIPVERGFFIYNGRYIPPPYTIVFDKNGISINKFPLSPRAQESIGSQYESDNEYGQFYLERNRQTMVMFLIERDLNADSLLIINQSDQACLFPSYTTIQIMEIIASEKSNEEKIKTLMDIPGHSFASWEWKQIIANIQPSSTLQARVATVKEKCAYYRNKDDQNGSGKYQVLAVAGLILSVLSLGILLSHHPKNEGTIKGRNCNSEAVKRVWYAISLFIALNLYDLISTLVVMKNNFELELNIIARSMLGTPLLLVCFKLGACGLAALIILKYRHYRCAQQAAWWSCVLYTVILFRWATVLI